MIAAFPMKGNFRWPRRWTFVRLPAVAQKCRRAELPRMKFPALPGRKLAFGGMTMKRNLKENLFEKRVPGSLCNHQAGLRGSRERSPEGLFLGEELSGTALEHQFVFERPVPCSRQGSN
ncbi:unnamed protein product [Symbiodinium necroappetens]|uniref:Uncharacterized protein n=1 Tax=Symbiodinium necroappetens TaxID=1628268 RepID=A0A812ZT64_9DINO|nr:unnamed protein product [Symbiodinium necroappetens]